VEFSSVREWAVCIHVMLADKMAARVTWCEATVVAFFNGRRMGSVHAFACECVW
jgi:hypothetical protein